MKKLLKNKWFIIGCIITLVSIILLVIFLFNYSNIAKALSVVIGTGLSLVGIKKGYKTIQENLGNVDKKKEKALEKVNNNTTDDNYKFGSRIAERIKRNKNNK